MKKKNIALIALLVALGAGNAQAVDHPITLPSNTDLNNAITASNADGFPPSTITFNIANGITGVAGDFTTINQSVSFITNSGAINLTNSDLLNAAVLTTDDSANLTLPSDLSVIGAGSTSGIFSINAIRGIDDLNLIAGDSQGLAGTYSVLTSTSNTSNAYAFYALGGSVNITGDLSGTVTATATNNNAVGIYARGFNGSITLNGNLSGNVTATAANSSAYGLRAAQDITINGTLSGDITATATNGSNAYGLSANDDLTITGGIESGSDITAYAGNSNAYGLFAEDYINISGSLNGDVSATAFTGSFAYGLMAEDEDLTITGDIGRNSDITAYAGNRNAYGLFAGDDLNITGSVNGDVSATANSGSNAYGLRADDNLTIGGDIGRHSVINATANNSYAYGLSAGDNLSINGSVNGDVSATATNGNNAYGLNAGDNLTIGGDIGRRSDISAYAGNSNAYGLNAGDNLNITGSVNGDVSATANSGSNAYGLNAGDNLTIGGDIGWRSDISAYAANNYAYGMYAGDGLTIDGHLYGDINATANTGILAAGLYSLNGNVTITQGIGSYSDISASAGNSFAYGIRSFGGNIIIGGELAGDITATAGDVVTPGTTGYAAAGLAANGQISGLANVSNVNGYDPLVITGNISATSANGTAAGIMAYNGPMYLDIKGTVSGRDLSDLTETGSGYAIISSGFNISSGEFLTSMNVNDIITVEGNGQLIGNVDLGGGDDLMTVKDSAIISSVPGLYGGDDGQTSISGGDQLVFNGWIGMLGKEVTGWEDILVTGDSEVDLGVDKDIAPSLGKQLLMTIDPGSTVIATGHSPGTYTISGDLVNNGTLDMGDDDIDDVVTVTGNYDGTGSLLIDADLSTSNMTSAERLIIKVDAGNNSGPTTVYVNNVVSPVAVTSGAGIEIITVDGSSASGMFTLGNPDDFGPFSVDLVQGASDSNWYLVSPGFREEAAVLQAVTPFIEKLGYESIPRFHERRAYTWFADKKAEQEAFWVRTYGSKYRLGLTGDAATSIHGYDGGFQLGTDILAGGDKNSRHNIGLYAGIGYIDGEVDGLRSDTAGKLIDTAYNFGTYLTLHGPNSYYVEAVGQASYHNLSIDYRTEPKQDVKFWSYLASLETGFSIPFSPCFSLQPQAQLIYQQTDGFGINTGVLTGNVDIAQHEGLQGRLGITGMFKSCDFDYNPFFEINLIKDFSDPSRVTYRMDQPYYNSLYANDPVTLSTTPETLFLGGAIGISRKVSEKNNLSYFLKAEAMYGLEGHGSYDYKLTAGIRKTW